MRNKKKFYFFKSLIIFFAVVIASSCMDSKVLIDLKNRTFKKTGLSTYFGEKIQLNKSFGVSGEFDLNTLKNKTIFSPHDFIINNTFAHLDGKFLFEISHSTSEPSTTIVQIDENGNYDPNFAPIYATEDVSSSKGLKILSISSDGSFFVTTTGVFQSCHNATFFLGDCHTLKKYLANGKLDINFGQDGIIDIPTPLTSNSTSYPMNSVSYIKELSNSKILLGGKTQEGSTYKFFFSILNVDGSLSQNIFVPNLIDIGQTEMIADVTIDSDSKWIITSYRFVQNTIYKRILNSDLSADNSLNAGAGYFSTPTARGHIVKHLVVDNEIFFISATLNPNSSFYTHNISSHNYSSISKYSIDTRTISHSNINHPTLINNGLLAYNMSYIKDDDNLFIFSFANFNQPELKKVVFNFEASNLTLRNTFGNSGSFVSNESYPFIRPLYSFGVANDNYITSFTAIHVLTNQNTIEDSVLHFKMAIEDLSGAPTSNLHVPLNGKAIKLKMPFQINPSPSDQNKRYLSDSGNLYLLFSNGVYNFKENSNFLTKISSNGKLDLNFGEGGTIKIDDGIFLKMLEDKNGNLNILYLKEKLPRHSDNYDFYIQQINHSGEKIQSFGANGRLIIGSSSITTGQVLFTSYFEHYYSMNVSLSISDGNYKIALANSSNSTTFISYDIKENISKKEFFNFNDLKNKISSIYNIATLQFSAFELSQESDSIFVLFSGNKIGVSNKDIGVLKFNMQGALVTNFGDNGISAKEIDQAGVLVSYLNQIEGKLQVIVPYQYVEGGTSIFMNSYLQTIDAQTGILENHISKIESDHDVLLINKSFPSSKNEVCFTGLQVKNFSLSTPVGELQLESFLSYLEFKNGVYTYKTMNFAGIDLFKNSVIEQISYKEDGIYLLLTAQDLITRGQKVVFTKIISY